jgi:hypothetical protein
MATTKKSIAQILKDGEFRTIGETDIPNFAFDYEESKDPVTGTLSFTAEVPPISPLLLRKWNLETYKSQVFKYNGNAEPVTIGEVWDTISRHNRRMIERLVKKGKNPDIVDYL